MNGMGTISRWMIVVFVLSLVMNVAGAVNYARDFKSIQATAEQKTEQDRNKKITDFLKLFVDKILKAKGEVLFEDRLKLENAVRDLGDAAILAKWQTFVDSKQSEDAQDNLKDFIGILVSKL